jgi:hypothetical protein
MVPGVAKNLVIASVLAGLDPQALLAITEMFPPVKVVLSMFTEMELVVDVPVIPAGNVQEYEVAPVTAVME